MGKSQIVYELEQVDRLITNLLIEDGRLSALKISKTLNSCSAQFVRNRIEHLIENNVFSIDAMLIPEALGYKTRVDIFIIVEAGQATNVAKKLAQIPAISRVACSVDNHISIQVYAQHYQDVYVLLTDIIHKIPGVKKTETNLVARLIKEFHTCKLPDSMNGKEVRFGSY
jgi:DNA-binding Lrp family transcriptional regulator